MNPESASKYAPTAQLITLNSVWNTSASVGSIAATGTIAIMTTNWPMATVSSAALRAWRGATSVAVVSKRRLRGVGTRELYHAVGVAHRVVRKLTRRLRRSSAILTRPALLLNGEPERASRATQHPVAPPIP